MMRFVVKSYFPGIKDKKKDRRYVFLEYLFNLFYRSIIPIGIVLMISEVRGHWAFKIFMVVMLCFFVFYQFEWRIEED